MALAGPFSIGQTLRLGNHANTDRTALTNAAGVATTPAAATLTVTKPDAASPGFRTSVTYTYPGTLVEESAGRLYVDVVPVSGEDGRWDCALATTTPTAASTPWGLVVERNPV
jgi:hypothetical protein